MRKFVILFAAGLVCLASCRSFEETQEFEQAACEDVQGDGEMISVTATLLSDTTKTALGENGYDVVWSEGDQITLYFSTSFIVTGYYAQNLTLSSGAGTKKGVFTGNSSALGLSFTPLFAMYPAVENPSVELFSKTYSFASYYENTQYADEFNKGNFRATTSVSGSITSGINCEFKELSTLIHFKVTPTEDMVSDSDVLKSITLKSTTTDLAGNITYNYSNAGAVSVSANNANPVRENTILFRKENAPVLKSGTPVEADMNILPGVVENEPFTISIITGNRQVYVNAKAAKNFLPGYKYSFTLDLPALVKSGNAKIVTKDAFCSITDREGVFDLTDIEHPADILTTEALSVQYAYNGNTCRFQDWNAGKICLITFPSGTFDIDSVVSLSVREATDQSEKVVSARIVRIEDSRYWLVSSDGNTGYILNRTI